MTTIDAGPAPDTTQEPQEKLYRYSAWIHIGEGADGCEQASTGGCEDPQHFHAWCRMPNQIQHEEIRERALAAKARRTRVLRDPQTDAHDALELTLDELARGGDAVKEALADELLRQQRWTALTEASTDVIEKQDGYEPQQPGDEGEPEPIKPYEHIVRDKARLEELQALEPDDRPADEFESLTRHAAAFDAEVEVRFHDLYDPQHKALVDRDISGIIDMVRDERIAREANATFMGFYSQEEWLECTLMRPGGPQRFKSLAEIRRVSPEEYEALRSTYDGLEADQVNPGN